MNSSRTPDPSWRSATRKPAPVLGSLMAEASASPVSMPASGTLVPSSFAELPSRATIAPRDLSEGDLARMTYAWGHAFPADAAPHHTLKGDLPPAAAENAQLKTRSTGPEETAVGQELQPQRVPTRDVIGPSGARDGSADYELLEVIGEGGVGVVYEARQASIDRTVAVKMLRSGAQEGNTSHRNKFLAEAVITGDLEHPNIVPVYDLALSGDDAVFYSMKRVQGTPWNEVLASRSQRENIEVLMRVADALAFAHSRGVIHRDLKPENVMLGDFGEVLVMDWGIAVVTPSFRKAAQVAATGGLGGTPAYMAPEMVTGPAERIDIRSDVYLLGAILFEIVTGQPPHPGDDAMECLYAAARNEIVEVPHTGELIEIAYRALSTDPADRFSDVPAFQSAVREYLSHSEAIALADQAGRDLAAAQVSRDYRDFARAVFAFEESIALWPANTTAVAGLAAAREAYALAAYERDDFDLGLSQLDEHDPRHTALIRKLKAGQAERNQRLQRLKNARRLIGALILVVFVVVSAALGVVWKKQHELASLNSELASTNNDLREKEGTVRNQRDRLETQKEQLVEKQGLLETALVDVTNERNAADSARRSESAAKDRAFQLQDITDKTAYNAVIGLAAEKIEENSFGEANRLLDRYADSPLRHWEWARLKYLCEQAHQEADAGSPVESLAFNPNGSRFVSGSADGTLSLWETRTMKLVGQVKVGVPVGAVSYAPTDDIIVAGCEDGHLRAWDASDPSKITELWDQATHRKGITSLAYSSEGRFLLSGSKDHSAVISDANGGESQLSLEGHSWWVNAVAFVSSSDEEMRVVTAGQDCRVVIWNIAAGNGQLAIDSSDEFLWHKEPVHAVAVAYDAKRIATAGRDGRIFIWDPNSFARIRLQDRIANRPDPEPNHQVLIGHTAAINTLSFEAGNTDRPRLLSGSDDNTLRLWDLDTNETIVTLRGHGSRVRTALFPPGASNVDDRVLSGALDGQIHLYDVGGYAESRVVQGSRFRGHEDSILSATFDSAGKQVVTASRDRTARVIALASGRTTVLEEGHAFLAARAAFLPNSAQLVTAAMDGTVRIWDMATGGELALLHGTGAQALVATSPDGQWLLTSGPDNDAQLWSVAEVLSDDAPRSFPLTGQPARLSAIAFSNDSLLALTGDREGHLWLWDVATRRVIRKLDGTDRQPGHRREITAIRFLPDGKTAMAASADNTVSRWNLDDGQEVGPRLVHADHVVDLAVASRGGIAVTVVLNATGESGYDSELAMWDLKTGDRRGNISVPGESIRSVDLDETGQFALTAGTSMARVGGDAVRLWNLESKSEVGDAGTGMTTPLVDAAKIGVTVHSARFAPETGRVLTVGGNNARLWEQSTGRELMVFSPHRAIANASFSQDGKFLVTGSWDGTAKVWEVSTGRDMARFSGAHQGPVTAALFAPDNSRQLMTAGADGTLGLWKWPLDEASPILATSIKAHNAAISAMSFDRTGQLLATASYDGSCRVWDRDDFSAPRFELRHSSPVLAVSVSQDAAWIVTGTEDRHVRIWNSADGREVVLPQPIRAHTAAVTSVSLSADRRRVFSASLDGTAKVWDAESGSELLALRGHESEVSSVQISPTGQMVLTAGYDGTAVIWDAVGLGPSMRVGEEPLMFVNDGESANIAVAPRGVIEDPTRADWSSASLTVAIEHEQDAEVGKRPFELVLVSEDETLLIQGNRIWRPRAGGEVSVATVERAGGELTLRFADSVDRETLQQVLRSIRLRSQDGADASENFKLNFELADGSGTPLVAATRDVVVINSTTQR